MRILLIYNSSFFDNTASSNIIKRFINDLEIDVYYVLIGYLNSKKNKILKDTVTLNSIIFSKTFYRLKKYLPIIRSIILMFEYYILPYINYIKIKKILSKNYIEKIWVFSCLETIPTAFLLMRKLSIPIHFSVHDDIPDNFYFFKRIANKKIVEFFVYLLQNSSSLDLISGYMLDEYKKKYKITNKSLPIWGGFCLPNNNNIKNYSSEKKKEIKIVYGGSISTMEEHILFWEVLDQLNNLYDLNITLDYYTHQYYIKYFKNKPNFISFNKFLDSENFNIILNEYDFAFVMMSFKKEYEFAMKVAFPSKLNTFLSSGLPLIGIAPEYSSLYKFINEHHIGICFSDFNLDDITNNLKDFFKDDDKLKYILLNIIKTKEKILNYDLEFLKFKEILLKN